MYTYIHVYYIRIYIYSIGRVHRDSPHQYHRNTCVCETYIQVCCKYVCIYMYITNIYNNMYVYTRVQYTYLHVFFVLNNYLLGVCTVTPHINTTAIPLRVRHIYKCVVNMCGYTNILQIYTIIHTYIHVYYIRIYTCFLFWIIIYWSCAPKIPTSIPPQNLCEWETHIKYFIKV